MLLEPLPENKAVLASLLHHESFHAHQEALGLPANNAVAAHLDDQVARYLIRLEWRALAAALDARGVKRKGHVAQALAFRAKRLGGSTADAAAERDQMRHEGLANYTGTVLSGDAVNLAREELKRGATRPSFGRSFAYASGPAWGLLLDDLRPDWRVALKGGSDLPELMPIEPAFLARPEEYGGTKVREEEKLLALKRQSELAAMLAATVENRSLKLPLTKIRMDFDPTRVTAAPDGSLIYHGVTLRDSWGHIKLEGTPLRVNAASSAAFVPWPLANTSALELNPGWAVKKQPGGGARLVKER